MTPDTIALTVMCAAYAVLTVICGQAILQKRPYTAFWRMCLVYITSPGMILVWLLGQGLLYLGAGFSAVSEMAVDYIAPERHKNQNYSLEIRRDLH